MEHPLRCGLEDVGVGVVHSERTPVDVEAAFPADTHFVSAKRVVQAGSPLPKKRTFSAVSEYGRVVHDRPMFSIHSLVIVRGRVVGTALLVGCTLGTISVSMSAYVIGIPTAADTAFLVGTLALGFGALGWSASVIAGPGMRAMQTHLEAPSDWDEADSRRAMARISGFGIGVMTAAIMVGMLFGYT